MRDDARFCPHCGTAVNSAMGSGLPQGAAPYGAPAYTGPEGPVDGGGKKKTGLFIGIGVAVVAVIALVAVFASGLFGSPKGQVEKAILKSAAAYTAAEEKLGMPDVSQWQQDQKVFQRMTLELTGINSELIGYDLSSLAGLGLQLSTDYDGAGRELFFDLNAYWENTVLLSFQMAADDAEMYFCLPQFTGDTYYGVNTETLGHDLTEMTGDNSMDSVSFNLFDLMDFALEKVDAKAMEQAIKEANKALWEAAQVEKDGKGNVDVNGTQTKADCYIVTVPQEALDEYVDALIGVMSSIDYAELYEELYRAMGIPQEQIDEIMAALTEFDPYGELADDFHDALEELGTLQLAVYVDGGYVVRVDRGGDLGVTLCLGGGGEYVDDLSLNIFVDGTQVTLKSNGDHGLKGGTYTDETTIQIRQQGTNVAKITSELSYDPKASGDNFQWELGAVSSGLSLFTLETEGNLSASKDAVSMNLDDISLRVMGMEVCDLSFEYSVSSQPRPLDIGSSQLITEMSLTELMALAHQVEVNAGVWVEDMQSLFLARLPQELLWSLMY